MWRPCFDASFFLKLYTPRLPLTTLYSSMRPCASFLDPTKKGIEALVEVVTAAVDLLFEGEAASFDEEDKFDETPVNGVAEQCVDEFEVNELEVGLLFRLDSYVAMLPSNRWPQSEWALFVSSVASSLKVRGTKSGVFDTYYIFQII